MHPDGAAVPGAAKAAVAIDKTRRGQCEVLQAL